jgi:hypothetical protein
LGATHFTCDADGVQTKPESELLAVTVAASRPCVPSVTWSRVARYAFDVPVFFTVSV